MAPLLQSSGQRQQQVLTAAEILAGVDMSDLENASSLLPRITIGYDPNRPSVRSVRIPMDNKWAASIPPFRFTLDTASLIPLAFFERWRGAKHSVAQKS
jgi:hypothetical protein